VGDDVSLMVNGEIDVPFMSCVPCAINQSKCDLHTVLGLGGESTSVGDGLSVPWDFLGDDATHSVDPVVAVVHYCTRILAHWG